jgi:hypothetical protein
MSRRASALHGGGVAGLRILRGRINQHPDFVFLIDQVGPVEVLDRGAPTRVRRLHLRRGGVAASGLLRGVP